MRPPAIFMYQAEQFERNALRHDAKAAEHEAAGRAAYAEGSRKKAAKWRAKRAALAKQLASIMTFGGVALYDDGD